MAAGDTFRAAACEQLEVCAERTGSEMVVAEGDKVKAPSVLSQAVKRNKEQGYDVVLCDTSGRLHTNYSLTEELVTCKKAVAKLVPGAPNEILLVLDGTTTGLKMLQQAREFIEVIGVTGSILTKLDGSACGDCVVSVVNKLGIPVKFVGVVEGIDDLQPFDTEAYHLLLRIPNITEDQNHTIAISVLLIEILFSKMPCSSCNLPSFLVLAAVHNCKSDYSDVCSFL